MAILGQALSDYLRYEMKLPLVGGRPSDEVITSALVHINKYPSIQKRLRDRSKFPVILKQIENAMED